jgi:glycosyltransferase involved in cell wall biosynthesis
LSPKQTADLDEPWIVRCGHVQDVAPVFGAMDIVCLPSHREGFPNVAVEAAASGLPLVTTDATGCVDAVVAGVTGLMVPVGDVDRLTVALDELACDESLRLSMGRAARELAVRAFEADVLTGHVHEYLDARTPGVRTPRELMPG